MSIRMPIAEVYRTSSVDDALAFLAEHPGARPLAGGTDLLVELRTRWGGPLVGKPGGAQGADGGGGADLSPASLLDISGLPELRDIRADGRKLVIGACARVAEVASSPQVAAAAPTLAQAAGSVGSVQIRNRATLGGNIMNASPAADSLPALAVHEAVCVLRSQRGGERRLRLGELVTGPYCTCARPDELLVAVELEGGSGWRQSYMRLGRRQAMTIARLIVAVLMRFEGSTVADVRISAGAAFPSPRRIEPAERALLGAPFSRAAAREAGEAAAEEMVRVCGIRWSTRYKQPVLAALVERAVRQCAAKEGLDEWPE
ncbi:MAG: xanthine dehydrogenase family protein subunit M [Firmicutes bacterium]|jgi:CO/xanthine dehydrogenase FAD-binding subunit|nr:xanthine dehydrogenase family protein subunit M [Bacillota bacterium]